MGWSSTSPGHTLLPGLIDCHTHLVGEPQGRDPGDRPQRRPGGAQRRRQRPPPCWPGSPTARDVGTFRAFVDVALRDAIDDGTVVGPRMAVAGAYVTVPGGGGSVPGQALDVELPRDLLGGHLAGRVRQRSGRSCTAAPTSSR